MTYDSSPVSIWWGGGSTTVIVVVVGARGGDNVGGTVGGAEGTVRNLFTIPLSHRKNMWALHVVDYLMQIHDCY